MGQDSDIDGGVWNGSAVALCLAVPFLPDTLLLLLLLLLLLSRFSRVQLCATP